jgi:hypothetical protein
MAMSDESWDEQFRQFLRKTGDDFRRTGEDIKTEAQKLLDAAMDPEKQQKVRDRLNELSSWARKTAQGVAGAMEDAATKAQTAFHRAADKVGEATGIVAETPRTPSFYEATEPKPAERVSSAAAKPAARRKASKPQGKSGKQKASKRKR